MSIAAVFQSLLNFVMSLLYFVCVEFVLGIFIYFLVLIDFIFSFYETMRGVE